MGGLRYEYEENNSWYFDFNNRSFRRDSKCLAAGQVKGRNFTDVDGNGICDNAKVVCSYVDEDQNGIYDHCKSGQGEVLTNGKGMRHRQGYRAGRNK